jgi:nucleotide-binding universal stress UspA family protein
MRSILICTDGSPYAAIALRYGRYLAEMMALVVKVLFVEDVRLTQGPLLTGYYGPVGMAPSPAYPAFYDDLVKTVKEQGRRAMDEARAAFEGTSLEVEYLVRDGIVRDCILEEARTVDLLCLGRQGEHGDWEGDDLGSTVEKVLRRSARPVLVTPGEFHEITRLLVAYDGSQPANRALRVACSLASDEGFEMIVAVVAESADERPFGERKQHEARELAAAYKDVDTQVVLLEGEEEERQLIEHAAQQGCDLIVMGAYGESRIREWLVGSTTSGVLARATTPVLCVR